MSRPFVVRRYALFVLPLAGIVCLVSLCQAQGPRRSRDRLEEPVLRVARADSEKPEATKREHPLVPVVQLARDGLEDFRKVADYSATLVKRERVDGRLQDHEYMFAKIRHEQTDEQGNVIVPFSVYLNFVGPANIKGREVIYVKGHNDGKLIAHEGGPILGLVTAYLDPEGDFAMRGCRYPITQIGILNLVERLVEVGERDMKYGECEVQTFDNATINGRVCKCIQVVHPYPRKNFRFHKAQIFIDKELGLPIRFASWEWPKEAGGKAVLLEEYTYLNLKLDNGFTDQDFDRNNPNYKFPTITAGS